MKKRLNILPLSALALAISACSPQSTQITQKPPITTQAKIQVEQIVS